MVARNYDTLMQIKSKAIRDQFKPLDYFYEEQRSKFKTSDIDLIDKAERYFEEALVGRFAEKNKKYETSEEVQKLMDFVDWAKRRGGDAWNDASEKPIDEMTEEEKEMRKPFYARTYHVGR